MKTLYFRHINITIYETSITECIAGGSVPQEYIIFCNIENEDLYATSIVKWDEDTDQRVWTSIGNCISSYLLVCIVYK